MILSDMSRKWTMTKKSKMLPRDQNLSPKIGVFWVFQKYSKEKILLSKFYHEKKTYRKKQRIVRQSQQMMLQNYHLRFFFNDKTLSWRFFNLKFAFFPIFSNSIKMWTFLQKSANESRFPWANITTLTCLKII